MKIECPSCNKHFSIDDAKVPSKTFSAKCPSCGGKITVTPPDAARAAAPQTPDTASAEGTPVFAHGSPQWEQLKREVTAEVLKGLGVKAHLSDDELTENGAKNALVCEDQPEFQNAIRAALIRTGYRVDLASSAGDSVKRVREHRYDLITVDSRFPDDPEGGEKILRAANGLPSVRRRKMVVAFIADDLASLDMNSAFILGANVTVNKKDIRTLEKILKQTLADHERLYRNFFLMEEEVKSLEVQGLRKSSN